MKLPLWPKDERQIIDEDGFHVCFANTMADRDYIVQAVNNHQPRFLIDAQRMVIATLKEVVARLKGFPIEGRTENPDPPPKGETK